MLVVLKLRDEVFVPEQAGPNVILGDDYYVAQKQRLLKLDEQQRFVDYKRFNSVYQTVQNLLGTTPLVCLYYTSDKVAFNEKIGYDHNLLNFFAFPYAYDAYTLQNDLKKLAPITELPEVDYWWYEGEMTLLSAVASPGKSAARKVFRSPVVQVAEPVCRQTNGYYADLGAAGFPFKGNNVQLVDAEDYGDTPRHTYLAHLNVTVVNRVLPSVSLESHFYKTLGVLFAEPTATGTEPVIGLVPDAKLLVFAFPPKSSETALIKAFAENFNQRRLITNALLIEKATILLIERAITLPIGRNQGFRFPIEVLADVRQLFIRCAKRNLIVVQPAAWQVNQSAPDLTVALPKILHEPGVRYTNFQQSFTVGDVINTGSASVLVSSIDANDAIQPFNNRGTLVDLYLWGQCVRSLDRNDGFAPFAYASAATAIAAGIVGTLQSAAFSSGKSLPLKPLKQALIQHFRAGGAPFTPATLPAVWGSLLPLLI